MVTRNCTPCPNWDLQRDDHLTQESSVENIPIRAPQILRLSIYQCELDVQEENAKSVSGPHKEMEKRSS
jgi:hypothetical protein